MSILIENILHNEKIVNIFIFTISTLGRKNKKDIKKV